MFNGIFRVLTIEVVVFISDFFSNKIEVIHTTIDNNCLTIFQEETLVVEVVFKGWVFNRSDVVWTDVKKDTYIKGQTIEHGRLMTLLKYVKGKVRRCCLPFCTSKG